MVCKECIKSVDLFLSKVEDMIYNGNEIKQIVQNQNNFVKNSHQDHNTQLLILLTNLRDEIDKLPTYIMRTTQESIGDLDTSFDTSKSHGNEYSVVDSKKFDIKLFLIKFVKFLNNKVDKLMKEQLLLPLVDSLTIYIKQQLQHLLKEGGTAVSNVATNKQQSNVDASKTVQLFIKQLPDILRVYIFSLPTSTVTNSAFHELKMRILCIFLTLCSLIRPMNETCKLRITADMTILEQTLNSFSHSSSSSTNVIIEEFKSFRRLLFENLFLDPNESQSSTSSSSEIEPPSKDKIFSLKYIERLRPNILISFLFSSSPSLLSLPTDLKTDVSYFDSVYILPKSQLNKHQETFDEFLKGMNDEEDLAKKDISIEEFPDSYCFLYSSPSEWKNSESQSKSWLLFQEALDLFIQRQSVMNDAKQRQILRKWYETILTIGGHYFGGNLD